MIPKYPDLVQWFLIGRHFSKQWSDHNYDHAPRGTGKEQDLSFEMACFQGCTDHVLLLRTQTDTHNTHTQWHVSSGVNDILKMLHKSQAFFTYIHTKTTQPWPHTNIHIKHCRFLVCVCVGVCCACLFVCVAEARQDPCSLGNKPFQTRDLVPYLYHMEHGRNCDLTIV